MFDEAIHDRARAVLDACRAAGLMVVCAESCSGGLVIGALTEIPGSSDVVERGFVTYSNRAKTEMLGVPPALIESHGAVSEAVVRAMAEGALARAGPHAEISIAVTGIAGPGGDSPTKPAGLVHLAAARRGKGVVHEKREFGDIGRDAVRRATVEAALDHIGRAGNLGQRADHEAAGAGLGAHHHQARGAAGVEHGARLVVDRLVEHGPALRARDSGWRRTG